MEKISTAEPLCYQMIRTPLGSFFAAATHHGLCRLLLPGQRSWSPWFLHHFGQFPVLRWNPILERTALQLNQYISKKRREFDLKLDLRGTCFQRKVWNHLLMIPFGKTSSYGQLAVQIGLPGAARAVGAANARNPVLVVVPCHRIIGSNGELVGFASGLQWKRLLLGLERIGSS